MQLGIMFGNKNKPEYIKLCSDLIYEVLRTYEKFIIC